MSAIQEISKNIEDFPKRLKQAKDSGHFTNQTLADESGVSLSSVARLLSGGIGDPKLYDVAAICRVLRVSLDDLFGLEHPAVPDTEAMERAHAAELESVTLRTREEMLEERMRSQRTLIFVLTCLVVVLAFALVVYLLLDLSIREEGFILWGSPTAYAWAVIFLIVGAVIAVGVTMYNTFKRLKNEKHGGEKR